MFIMITLLFYLFNYEVLNILSLLFVLSILFYYITQRRLFISGSDIITQVDKENIPIYKMDMKILNL